jgi:hypothetical protein
MILQSDGLIDSPSLEGYGLSHFLQILIALTMHPCNT